MVNRDQLMGDRTLSALLDLLPIGVAISHDADCSWISVNKAAAKLLRIEPGSNASLSSAGNGLKFRLFHGGKELSTHDLPMQVSAATGAELRDYEVECINEDGTRTHLLEYASPLRDERGTITGCVGVFIDVTPSRDAARQKLEAQTESERRLREMNESLELRVAERTAQARARAEQLRTLALALADAEAHERKRLAQLLHDQLQQVLSAAKLKAGLIRRMSKEPPVESNLRDLERLIEAAIGECRSLTRELAPPVLYDAGLNAAIEALARTTEQDKGLKVVVNADAHAEPEDEQLRVLLFEAVREMVQNVIEHAQATEVMITSSVLGTDRIQVLISDNGKGFDVMRLSQPRRKGETDRLGLLEIRERLNHVGGDLQIRSHLGQGTTVTLATPGKLREVDFDEAAFANQIGCTEPSKPAFSNRATIVVADDHAIFREGLISLLRQEKVFDIIGEAGDGQQALDLVRQLRPDILVVDISMPKLNGLEVTRILSREMPQTHIVGLSMYDTADMDRAMRDAGAAAYITKDSASETLVGVLQNLLKLPRSA